VMQRAMYFADFTVQAGREFVQKNGGVTEDQILKATADALADKMSKELNDVVGVGIEPPFGGLVPFGKRSAFPHAVPSKDQLQPGDALILSFGAQVGGYSVECRSEEHTSELQSHLNLVCRLLLEKKKTHNEQQT